jgi:hypothetical protein
MLTSAVKDNEPKAEVADGKNLISEFGYGGIGQADPADKSRCKDVRLVTGECRREPRGIVGLT